MRLIALFGMASLAAFGASDHKADQHADHKADGGASCCSQEQTEVRYSYLELKTPVPASVVKGAVTGTITFDGEAPKADPLAIKEDAAKGCTDEGTKVDPTDRSLVLGKDGGIQNVVITVKVKDAEVKVPEEPIKIDQMACRYEPHVVLIPVGSTVAYLNSDKVSHNVHTYPGRNDAMNKTVAPGSSEKQVLKQADKIEVKCDIHPWMNAYMFVTDAPYSAVTAADGSFSIEGLPAGEYKAELWHEKLGKQKGIKITVNEDGSCEPLALKMGAEKKKKGRGRR